MTPKFAKAVDPVFLGVLDLLERIERNQPIAVADERIRIEKKLSHAESLLGQTHDWILAKYALVCWIDAMLIGAPWEGNREWTENPLEVVWWRAHPDPNVVDYRQAYVEFYRKGRHAAALPNKDALEVFYICAVMGFRGMYGDNAGMMHAQSEGFPPRLDDWARQTAASIQLGQGRPPIHEKPKLPNGAFPLNGRSAMISMSVFGVVTFGIALGILLFKAL